MPANILVVDDEPQIERLVQRRFRKKINSGIYQFSFAQNGQEALEKVSMDESIDMVLTDINMPKMDGLTFITKLKEVRPSLKAVMVSAYGDMENLRKAMNLGAYDFLIKPIDFKDLAVTIDKTLEEVAVLKKAELAKELAQKNEHLEELDRLKSQFFTNISHEFRTPLTIINGIADQILENPSVWAHKGGKMILRNGHHLLDLVNRILDLRKLESGKLQLQLIQTDIVPYLNYLFESFQSFAETKDIQLRYTCSEKVLVMDYDPEKLMCILSNLLDNAIKFTQVGGQVHLKVDKLEEILRIRIIDSGVGIPAKQLKYIFDRFFQVNDTKIKGLSLGTGIGLALVNELIGLMNGEIIVDSKEHQGSTFIIHLPIKRNAIRSEEKPTVLFKPQFIQFPGFKSTIPANENLADLPNLLIIEDNPDVNTYLVSCLEGHYRLYLAENGEIGINKAFNEIPDLILSDVMMPRKSGFEVCKILKKDERTSHIPIILLSAKADMQSKIKGLEYGADAYLAKPFNKKELFVRIEGLLEQCKRLQARNRGTLINSLQKSDPNGSDEDHFIKSLKASIESHISDENFGVVELCRMAGLSRTQLHRKIKGLTGLSASIFIRSIRLNKAKELLLQSDLNISQIAYEVGFKDPKYFSRTFTELFGQAPNRIRS